jgi:hypothetical protein
MASSTGKEHETHHEAAQPHGATPTDDTDAKKKVSPVTGTGPDGTLTLKQLVRAATEYLMGLRPQPTPDQHKTVIEKLSTLDEKGELKHKVKDAEAAIAAAKTAFEESKKGA